MPPVSTPAIVLSSLRYSETSKIVRLATREYGVQSAIAKGAMRPRSRFGAALQLLSEGQAHLMIKEHRELQLLTAFDLNRLHVGLAARLEAYAVACALAEVMLRFAPPDPHPESFDLFQRAFTELESASAQRLDAMGFRLLWQLVSVLGFAPSLEVCVLDGAPLPPDGPLAFSTRDGGALCARCAETRADLNRLPQQARSDLRALLDPAGQLPVLDPNHSAAHRRLLARYIRFHLGEGSAQPALEFWMQRSWEAA